jgi:hypothetical protein
MSPPWRRAGGWTEGFSRGISGERQLKGFQLRWREAGDTEGEIEGWRNTQQGYGSFR